MILMEKIKSHFFGKNSNIFGGIHEVKRCVKIDHFYFGEVHVKIAKLWLLYCKIFLLRILNIFRRKGFIMPTDDVLLIFNLKIHFAPIGLKRDRKRKQRHIVFH